MDEPRPGRQRHFKGKEYVQQDILKRWRRRCSIRLCMEQERGGRARFQAGTNRPDPRTAKRRFDLCI